MDKIKKICDEMISIDAPSMSDFEQLAKRQGFHADAAALEIGRRIRNGDLMDLGASGLEKLFRVLGEKYPEVGKVISAKIPSAQESVVDRLERLGDKVYSKVGRYKFKDKFGKTKTKSRIPGFGYYFKK